MTDNEILKALECCQHDDNSCKYREIDCDCVKFDFNPNGSVNFAECLNFMTRPPQSWCYVESEE